MNIQGRSAFVSGGGSGLAEAAAHKLARLGAMVAVLDDGSQRAPALRDRHGTEVQACRAQPTAS